MIEGNYLYFYDNLEDVFFIRKKVFNIDDSLNEVNKIDIYSQKTLYTIVYDNKKPVATGTLFSDDGTFRMEQVAVLEEERGKGYGDFVVRLIIDKAILLGAKEISIACEMDKTKFFEKLGFIIDDMEHQEVGNTCVTMKLKKDSIKKCCHK